MNQNKGNVVIVLAKKPAFGKVKSRIANDTSDTFAYKFSLACLEDLLNNLNNSNFFDLVVGTDTREDLEWFERTFNLSGVVIEVNPEANLSERMKFIFNTLASVYEYEKIILIPMDMPFIQVEEIISAFSRLDRMSYVLGPETNGGIYLIGMKSNAFKRKLFDNVTWSTPHSFDHIIRNFGLKDTYKLKFKDDFNAFQDILTNRDQIKLYCPKLFDLLQREGYSVEGDRRYVDFDTIDLCLPTVSAIIERNNNGKAEILLQTRNKPNLDPIYSGCYEIPSGLIKRYESAYQAVIREVKEETGLDVEPDPRLAEKVSYDGNKNDSVLGYSPFYVSQQTKGGRAYLNLGFICQLKELNMNLIENKYETKDLHWITLEKLEIMLKKEPNKFFLLNQPILQKYLNYKKDG